MSRIRIFTVFASAALVTTVLALGWQQPTETSAHGVIDQQNDVGGNASSLLNAVEPAGQEFTPTMNTIVGVEVRLRSFNQDGAADITLRIRDGTISGQALGSATLSLAQNLISDGEWVHFGLPSAVNLTPGQVYVLELETSNNSHAWDYETPGDYPGGSAVVQGSAESTDWMFRTYGQGVGSINGDVDCNGIVNSVDSLKVLRHNAGLSVSQTEPCPDIGQANP